MKRTNPQRITAILWAALFLLSTVGEGFGLQPCPVHDALLGTAETEAGEQDAQDTGHHHHSDELPGSTDDRDAHGDHSHHGPCTHVEACHVASGAVLPVDVEATIIVVRFVDERVVIAPVERLSVDYPPFFLPYSNAPPAHG